MGDNSSRQSRVAEDALRGVNKAVGGITRMFTISGNGTSTVRRGRTTTMVSNGTTVVTNGDGIFVNGQKIDAPTNHTTTARVAQGEVWLNGTKISDDGGLVEIKGVTKVELVVKGAAGNVNVDCANRVTIEGNVSGDATSASGSITVGGEVKGDVKTQSGDIKCGAVGRDVSSMSGDITCGNIGGSVSTMSGDVSHRR